MKNGLLKAQSVKTCPRTLTYLMQDSEDESMHGLAVKDSVHGPVAFLHRPRGLERGPGLTFTLQVTRLT